MPSFGTVFVVLVLAALFCVPAYLGYVMLRVLIDACSRDDDSAY